MWSAQADLQPRWRHTCPRQHKRPKDTHLGSDTPPDDVARSVQVPRDEAAHKMAGLKLLLTSADLQGASGYCDGRLVD